MKRLMGVSILALALAAPFSLSAQDDKDEKETYIYATYFFCKNTKFEALDAEVAEHTAPVYDAAVKDGTLGGWGWLAHHTGGKWNRIFYTVSDSMSGLFASQKTMAERTKDLPSEAFDAACGLHEDYIWQSVASNGLLGDRGSAGMSVYHVCDINREERADELVKNVFAPVYDKAIEDGKITSWGWSSHVIGGEYRKLSTMTGDSFEAVVKARGEILQAVYGDGDNSDANEFSEICGSHSDYLWQVLNEGRPGSD
jgi:hypothetical protein